MNGLNIYEMVATGSIGIMFVVVAGLVISWTLSRVWRWIDRDELDKPSWLSQKILNLAGCGDDGIGEIMFAVCLVVMIVPQILTVAIMFYTITLPVLVFIAVMYLARYGVDHKKVFNEHVKDINAHKETPDE